MLKSTFALITFFFFSGLHGQNTPADSGRIEIIEEEKIKNLLSLHIEINSKAPVSGFRIKIHFGPDKTKANDVKAKFISLFPEVAAYTKYDQPNFNVRVGDFRSRLDAYRFLKQIQQEFPTAFIVQDEIEFPLFEIKN